MKKKSKTKISYIYFIIEHPESIKAEELLDKIRSTINIADILKTGSTFLAHVGKILPNKTREYKRNIKKGIK